MSEAEHYRFRRPDAKVICLLEKRHAGKIGMGKADPSPAFGQGPTALVPDDARRRPDHGVAVAENVYAGDEGTQVGVTVNLSVTGMLVRFAEPTALPERTDFRLRLPNGTTLSGQCRVMRRHGATLVGISLARLDPAQIAHLRVFLFDMKDDLYRAA